MQYFAADNDVTIEHFDFYQKQSLRNRCHILGAEKTITLSVPLLGGRNQKTIMKDLRIDYRERWQQDHRKAILSCYAKSPFYEYYADAVFNLISTQHIFLTDLNFAIIQQSARWIKWEGDLKVSQEYIADQFLPKALNNQRNTARTQTDNKPYIQVFDDRLAFKAGLSFLDALFCLGPGLRDYLRLQAAKT